MLFAKSWFPAHREYVCRARASRARRLRHRLRFVIPGLDVTARRTHPPFSGLCAFDDDAIVRGLRLVFGYHFISLVRLDPNIARIAGLAERLKSRTCLRRRERTGDRNLRISGADPYRQQQCCCAQIGRCPPSRWLNKYPATSIGAHILAL